MDIDTKTVREIAICVDFDGTLSKNNGHRSFYDESKVFDDSPNQPIIDIIKSLQKCGYKIIIVSGRQDSCKDASIKWLQKYDIKFDDFFMRKHGDSRNDAIVKEEIYRAFIEPIYDVLAIFDDRDRVVQKWRSLGLTCLQVAPGDF